MTPKEKANNLCMRFLIQTTTDIPYGINKTIAKQCALIAVDEILNEYREDYEEVNKDIYTIYSWWQEVKQEIKNL